MPDVDGGIGQRRAAKASQVNRHLTVLDCAERTGYRRSRFQFHTMALPVTAGQRMAGKALSPCNGQGGGGVQAPGQ